jgi:hypothetical protein
LRVSSRELGVLSSVSMLPTFFLLCCLAHFLLLCGKPVFPGRYYSLGQSQQLLVQRDGRSAHASPPLSPRDATRSHRSRNTWRIFPATSNCGRDESAIRINAWKVFLYSKFRYRCPSIEFTDRIAAAGSSAEVTVRPSTI